MTLYHKLPPGPLDIVGDVHGEFPALQALMDHLGYDEEGLHPQNRKLVFVGDLIDRGPDSLAVVYAVRAMWEAGRAFAVLGNHELNLLLGRLRSGNQWFHGEPEHMPDGRLLEQRLAGETDRDECLSFFRRLPLVLERRDLRVVHACWDQASVDRLKKVEDAVSVHEQIEDQLVGEVEGRKARQSLEQQLRLQNLNPVRVLTSGLEEACQEPFMAGGSLRRQQRSRWWCDYQDPQTVVFGHYWRSKTNHIHFQKGPDLFADEPALEPLGPNGNAWCVDYSMGFRSRLQLKGDSTEAVGLAALRYPEKELVFAPEALPQKRVGE
ncbi:MAG: metallophosphoesterase [Planctomycetota bacterium]|nr:MAG: metallophosphoesterase [Planctomycetota bacterium]